MATLNGHPITKRHNRPSSNDAVLLELYNSRNGRLQDAYSVCSVHVFPDVANGDSSYWIDQDETSSNYGLVDQEKAHTQATMIFTTSSHTYTVANTPGFLNQGDPDASGFSESLYNPADPKTASGIFKVGEGHLGVVLLQGAPLAGAWSCDECDFDEGTSDPTWPGLWTTNNTDQVRKYFDIWTVRTGSGPNLTTFIHSFEMTTGGNLSFTEPLLVNTQHALVQKYVNNNSIVKLQVNTEHNITNSNISEEIRNLFNDSVITNCAMRIIRLADSATESVPFEVVKDWEETRPDIGIDSDDTVTYLWDTTEAHAIPGTYQIQIESEVFDQTVRSNPFTLILR
jgi:hypothetical protein